MAKKPKAAKATRPNAGLQMEYQRKLQSLVDDMSTSVNYWLSAEYKKQEPKIVGDASPAKLMNKKLLSVMARWRETFNKKAEDIATWFVRRSDAYASNSVKNKLTQNGTPANNIASRQSFSMAIWSKTWRRKPKSILQQRSNVQQLLPSTSIQISFIY